MGTNKRKLVGQAVKLLQAEHGTGPVERPQAFCSCPIQRSDIEITELPWLE